MRKSFLEKILATLAVCAVFFVPLLYFPHRLFPFTTSKNFFFMGLAEACFFLWAYLALVKADYRLSRKQLVAFSIPLILLVSLTVSGLLAPNRNLAFWSSFERGTGLIFLYHCLAFAVVIASLAKAHGKSFISKLYHAVFFSGLILAISALFTLPNGSGLIGNSSYAGAYLIFSFFIGGIVFFRKRNVWHRIWVSASLIVILVAPIVGRARGAALGLIAGLCVALCAYLATRAGKAARIAGIVLLSCLLAGTVAAGVAFMQPTSRLHAAFVERANDARFTFWKIAEKGIAERPVFGWGPENYRVVFAKYFDPTILEPGKTHEGWVDKPHNAVAEAFVAGGYIGGILYLLFMVSFFILPAYLYRKKVLAGRELALFEGLFFAYVLQNMIIFDTVATYVALFAVFGILAGAMPVPALSGKPKAKWYPGQSAKVIAAGACLLLFIPAWVFFVHLPAKKAKAIYAVYSGKNGPKDFSVLKGVSPMGDGTDAGYVADLMVSTYQNRADAIKGDQQLLAQVHADTTSFLAVADTLSAPAATDYRLWNACAELVLFDVAITKDLSDETLSRAQAYADRTRALSPDNPAAYVVYGRIFTYKQDIAAAHRYFLQARDIDPKVLSSQEYLDRFEQAFGTQF
ncbi:MAG: O-antigen ligase family protein [bacterium]